MAGSLLVLSLTLQAAQCFLLAMQEASYTYSIASVLQMRSISYNASKGPKSCTSDEGMSFIPEEGMSFILDVTDC